ncbi:hypothetical protein L484_024063 [Morus notabilis]|uniref:Uncharacterized protein n=1 Tax=Morus notabilis TaxID=981085 RepID=W9SEA9_9ROSA|nr:hypothetical protein L484_024063 [Morus notabilis]
MAASSPCHMGGCDGTYQVVRPRRAGSHVHVREITRSTVGNHFASYPTDRICPYFVLVTDRSA